mmetsp:Transcript_33918/g.54331  ORF Transcript_33918/g.54331 Transcript_33918/m.54331 type:complete len:273 (-) Transcript_33918:870-1688(-)
MHESQVEVIELILQIVDIRFIRLIIIILLLLLLLLILLIDGLGDDMRPVAEMRINLEVLQLFIVAEDGLREALGIVLGIHNGRRLRSATERKRHTERKHVGQREDELEEIECSAALFRQLEVVKEHDVAHSFGAVRILLVVIRENDEIPQSVRQHMVVDDARFVERATKSGFLVQQSEAVNRVLVTQHILELRFPFLQLVLIAEHGDGALNAHDFLGEQLLDLTVCHTVTKHKDGQRELRVLRLSALVALFQSAIRQSDHVVEGDDFFARRI